jgi:hypothetical protein
MFMGGMFGLSSALENDNVPGNGKQKHSKEYKENAT